MPHSDLAQLFDPARPIIQAPMAGVATPALAAAVSNAGALGSIAVGASTSGQAREMMDALRRLTERPFNVNVFCHRPATSIPTARFATLKLVSGSRYSSGTDHNLLSSRYILQRV